MNNFLFDSRLVYNANDFNTGIATVKATQSGFGVITSANGWSSAVHQFKEVEGFHSIERISEKVFYRVSIVLFSNKR